MLGREKVMFLLTSKHGVCRILSKRHEVDPHWLNASVSGWVKEWRGAHARLHIVPGSRKGRKGGGGGWADTDGGGAVARARGKIMVSETVKANHIQMGKLVRATVERNRAEQKRGKLSQRREEEEGGVGPE